MCWHRNIFNGNINFVWNANALSYGAVTFSDHLILTWFMWAQIQKITTDNHVLLTWFVWAQIQQITTDNHLLLTWFVWAQIQKITTVNHVLLTWFVWAQIQKISTENHLLLTWFVWAQIQKITTDNDNSCTLIQLVFNSHAWRIVLNAILYDKIHPWLDAGRWFIL
jgi:hypothetical protein